LGDRESAEYERLRELAANREVKAMEMTWAERMEVEYTRKGVQQGIQQGIQKAVSALREIVLRQMGQRFGTVPEEVRHKVEAIEEIEPLADLAKRVLEVKSLDDMGLS
jgi:hypothetical protein